MSYTFEAAWEGEEQEPLPLEEFIDELEGWERLDRAIKIWIKAAG